MQFLIIFLNFFLFHQFFSDPSSKSNMYELDQNSCIHKSIYPINFDTAAKRLSGIKMILLFMELRLFPLLFYHFNLPIILLVLIILEKVIHTVGWHVFIWLNNEITASPKVSVMYNFCQQNLIVSLKLPCRLH